MPMKYYLEVAAQSISYDSERIIEIPPITGDSRCNLKIR